MDAFSDAVDASNLLWLALRDDCKPETTLGVSVGAFAITIQAVIESPSNLDMQFISRQQMTNRLLVCGYFEIRY